jgi:Xaa-Pro aminopeptidase
MGNLNTFSRERLIELRATLKTLNVDGFIVPHSDEYQNEFLPARAERLAWLTAFDGSAGLAIITANKAAIFVDGRYTLQVQNQVDNTLYSYEHLTDHPVTEWVQKNLCQGTRLAYDSWLHSANQVNALELACSNVGAKLVAVDTNPIDEIWKNQPEPPKTPIIPHELRYSGRTSLQKCEEVALKIVENNNDAVVLNKPESIAWLLNVRGNDVPYTPLPLSFAILNSDATVDWFVYPEKISKQLISHIGKRVLLHSPDELGSALDKLGKAGAAVQICPDTTSSWIYQRLTKSGADIHQSIDPVVLPKAIKNEIELSGSRSAHLRDGVAIVKFLAWLVDTMPKREITEISAAHKLAEFRSKGDLFRGLSFETISGSGPNAAIVHYRVTQDTVRHLCSGVFYLFDSGGQYLDGTTDVTRTIALGAPSDEMRDRYTRVLKGHIAIATSRFPAGTTGAQIDGLARQFLWQLGLDYDHGTGHGVGSYLGVHEGPQRISKAGTKQVLQPGMIISNEPGYYKQGSYGIRIENLLAVVVDEGVDEAKEETYSFETLTLAPIDLSCVELPLLTLQERVWINGYHSKVMSKIGPLVDSKTRDWLSFSTRELEI